MKSLICTGGIVLAFALASITAAEAQKKQKKMTYENALAKSKSRASSGSAIRPYSRKPYSYSRDDPYAPGVNWPKSD